MFNLLYKGEKIYQNLSYEECVEVLQEFSEKYYEDSEIEFDPAFIELEEIKNG